MACCKVCCGCVECDEGQEGKCCCGSGSGAECCQEGEYCVSGVCQTGCCVTDYCSEPNHTQTQCEEACYRFGSLNPSGGPSDFGYDLSGGACTAEEFCVVYTDASENECDPCPSGSYRVPGLTTVSLCQRVTTDLSACPDFDPNDPLADPLCVCYSEQLSAAIQALGTWEDPCGEAPPP